jgi:hypothetical protein
MDICRTVEPPDAPADGRLVKCHLYTDGILTLTPSQTEVVTARADR